MMKEDWVYRRGDIYFADLDPVVGSEQGGTRPVIVIQNDTGNKHSPTLIVATVTTRIRKKENMPTHLLIKDNPAFREASVVQLEQIRTIDKCRIDNYLGKVALLANYYEGTFKTEFASYLEKIKAYSDDIFSLT